MEVVISEYLSENSKRSAKVIKKEEGRDVAYVTVFSEDGKEIGIRRHQICCLNHAEDIAEDWIQGILDLSLDNTK